MTMDLYWLDIETTGLDPVKDQILELAMYKSSIESPLDAKPFYHCVYRYILDTSVVLSPFQKKPVDPAVIEMHTKNGLFKECAESKNNIFMSEQYLLAHIPEEKEYKNKPVLAGNSVHFDHDFLKAQLPDLARKFSHRHYDVSSVLLFCHSFGMEKPPNLEAHRAEEDVLASLRLAKHCTLWFKGGY